MGAGRWRALHFAGESSWPAAHVQQERRKYLLDTDSGTWLLKFAGLGAHGERALARARMLQDAGFAPPVAGLRHGFLVQRWLSAARPLSSAHPVPPGVLLPRVAEYLAFRSHALPAPPDRGASAEELHAMARHDVAQALGSYFARKLDALRPAGLRPRRVETDNRMQPWEWLALPGGAILKTDGVDHCQAHDLVGCQDIAWDVAGARLRGAAERYARRLAAWRG